MTIGGKIRAARKAKGWSQLDLARAAGCTQPAIKKIEADATKRSRYLPEIARALELEIGEVDARFLGSIKNDVARINLPSNLLLDKNATLPVYGTGHLGNGTMSLSAEPVDFVSRPEPLTNVKDGYAVLVSGDCMAPVFEPGDVLLIHPHLPPVTQCDVILYSEAGHAIVRRLLKATDTTWHVRQWSPAKGQEQDYTLPRKSWRRCHRIVGKYSRR